MTHKNELPIRERAFQDIVVFYLLECPVRVFRKETIKDGEKASGDNHSKKYNYFFHNVSVRGRSFAERGLDGAKLNTLRAAMKRVAKTDLILNAVDGEVEPPESSEEYIVIRKNENISITEGYFYCIRNALAHGEINIIDGYYYMENHKQDKLKGVAKLSEETLIEWIKLVEKDVEEIQEIVRKR